MAIMPSEQGDLLNIEEVGSIKRKMGKLGTQATEMLLSGDGLWTNFGVFVHPYSHAIVFPDNDVDLIVNIHFESVLKGTKRGLNNV